MANFKSLRQFCGVFFVIGNFLNLLRQFFICCKIFNVFGSGSQCFLLHRTELILGTRVKFLPVKNTQKEAVIGSNVKNISGYCILFLQQYKSYEGPAFLFCTNFTSYEGPGSLFCSNLTSYEGTASYFCSNISLMKVLHSCFVLILHHMKVLAPCFAVI